MTKPFQENFNEQIIRKRKKSQKNMQNTKRRYDAMKEHNYFRDSKKKRSRWPNETVNFTEEITNNNDELDSSLDWFMDLSSSDDEEEDLTDISLSLLLKRELEKDLQKKCKNKKSPNDLNLLHEDQLYDELNNNNNHNLLNISNDTSNIICENQLINDEKESNVVPLVSLTNDATIIQNPNITNGIESQIKLSGQPCKELVMSFDLLPNVSVYKKVSPPLQWKHLIYLAIKNSSTENVTCYDIERFIRYWFPYYNNRPYVKFINFILNCADSYFNKNYFFSNILPINMGKNSTWTVNNIYINTLEENLMTIVENNEDEIKAAMTNPEKLSTILNGYSVFYLGLSKNL
ncbi:uncharacterized protein LOC114124723 isoform X1 [Aphis gossypii]|uniref:uncharacterized protein LOC114124723 isoform X1 n=1 Tax=Aphis gossypii TaxID=80765 RepID=UPI0021590C4E|nr:uncharacterized protein LOC114124723 isoform X1 [Aphis gossypii]XP_050058005.1 uncharacterized protein LOC114124723 isoform X1 [Aphis gossypii]